MRLDQREGLTERRHSVRIDIQERDPVPEALGDDAPRSTIGLRAGTGAAAWTGHVLGDIFAENRSIVIDPTHVDHLRTVPNAIIRPCRKHAGLSVARS